MLGFQVREDRDNFDYLYQRKDLAELTGRKFSKKRNLIKAFLNNYDYEGKPLLEEHIPDALSVLEQWHSERTSPGDYKASREALENCEALVIPRPVVCQWQIHLLNLYKLCTSSKVISPRPTAAIQAAPRALA